MQKIGTNQEVINYLQGEYSLLDSKVTEFKIYESDGLVNIDITFQLTHSKAKIAITFKNVVEYAFYHNSSHYFYYVETPPKFLSIGDGNFYLSLDPNEMIEGASGDDNDIIISKELEAFIIK